MTLTAKPSPLLGLFLVLCAAIFTALPASVRSEEAPKAQSDMEATEPGTARRREARQALADRADPYRRTPSWAPTSAR